MVFELYLHFWEWTISKNLNKHLNDTKNQGTLLWNSRIWREAFFKSSFDFFRITIWSCKAHSIICIYIHISKHIHSSYINHQQPNWWTTYVSLSEQTKPCAQVQVVMEQMNLLLHIFESEPFKLTMFQSISWKSCINVQDREISVSSQGMNCWIMHFSVDCQQCATKNLFKILVKIGFHQIRTT